MRSQEWPDKVQVSRYANGALIAVGLPWDRGLLVQEYWLEGRPRYAVANTSNEPRRVSLSEWNRGVGRPLAGPWLVPADAVASYDVDELVTEYSGSLVAVLLDDDPVRGLLKKPRPFDKPARWAEQEGVLTVDGLNGVGDRDANLVFLQERLRFRARATVSLKLHVPEGVGKVHFQDSIRAPKELPQAFVLEATSETLPLECAERSCVIYGPAVSGREPGEVTLTVQLPEVDFETLAVLIGRVVNPGGAGFSFARGLIVGDKD